MLKYLYLILFAIIITNLNNVSTAKENFFSEAKNMYDKKKLEESKFLFQRNIVFNPKDAQSYLYLAKIYNFEENESEEIKYLKTTLLLEPDNEEALYMLIDIELKKSNFSKVRDLTKNFKIICSTLCDKIQNINERLKNIEAKNEPKQ
jgi:tetratricopeptide (TPR) repeat protein|tara:strand:- start:531 stop:974 length:444 start_codon:yes stop_codon:yes gene_type:complete